MSSPSSSQVPVIGTSESASVATTRAPSKRAIAEKKRKAPALRSPAWEHFKKVVVNGDVRAICNHCDKNLAAVTSNGTKSLLRHVLTTCPILKGKGQGVTQSTITKDGGVAKHNEAALRRAIACMVITDELSFSLVEKKGFRNVMSVARPEFKVPSRKTVKRDMKQMYEQERLKLKDYFHRERQRISITTDIWTSNQNASYMSLTAHYIDKNWVLHKKILNFRPITSHKAKGIGKAVEDCLLEWEINEVLTVTVDNAAANDGAVDYLRSKMKDWGSGGVLKGKHMHMRCMSHIVNLMVQDGLNEKAANDAVSKIRVAVRYVKKSPQRLAKFKECIKRAKIQSKALLRLDVSTRWNSTYLMLEAAEKFEKAFEYYVESEPLLAKELRKEAGGLLSEADWSNARRLNVFLCKFFELTKRISGTSYITSNTFFSEITHVAEWLEHGYQSDDVMFVSMARRMKEKYAKYWGDMDQMNMLIYIGCILDPQRKFKYIEVVINHSHRSEPDKAFDMCKKVKNALADLFAWYLSNSIQDGHTNVSSTSTSSFQHASSSENFIDVEAHSSGPWVSEADKIFLMLEGGSQCTSELDKYLTEEREPTSNVDLDILIWWRNNNARFPILSELARDVLAIPITTVASESAFSLGERVIDEFRSSLNPDTVEALICSSSWMTKQGYIAQDEQEDDQANEDEEELTLLLKDCVKNSIAESEDVLDSEEEEDYE